MTRLAATAVVYLGFLAAVYFSTNNFYIAIAAGVFALPVAIASIVEPIIHLQDNPPPVSYPLPISGVCSNFVTAMSTTTLPKQVSKQKTHEDTHPLEGQPFYFRYTFTIKHPELAPMKQHIPAKDSDLSSTLILDAYIQPSGNSTQLRLVWTRQAHSWASHQPIDEVKRLLLQRLNQLIQHEIAIIHPTQPNV